MKLRRLSRIERHMVRNIFRNKTTNMLDAVRSLTETSVSLVFTDLACPHQCRHCALSAPPMTESRPITIDVVNQARKAGFIKSSTRLMFSGGEPLAHPDIFNLISQTNGVIPLSNGFPKSVSLATRRNLIGLGLPVMGASFHMYDSSRGVSLGRDELLAYIIEQPNPIFHIMTHSGGELDSLSAWVKTLDRIFYTPEMSASLRTGRVNMDTLSRLPVIGINLLGIGFLTQFGRAEKNGLCGLKLPSILPAFFNEPYSLDLYLLPDGSLVSSFIGRHLWTLAPVLGSVGDSPIQVLANLKQVLSDHFSKLLNRTESEWDAEIDLHIQNAELQRDSFLFIYSGLREGKLNEELEILKDLVRKLGLLWKPALTAMANASDSDILNLFASETSFPHTLLDGSYF